MEALLFMFDYNEQHVRAKTHTAVLPAAINKTHATTNIPMYDVPS